jgi:predicted nucleotidyltransferase
MRTLAQPPTLRVDLPLPSIAELCRRYGVRELAVFGSALRDDFTAQSDLDFLVTFHHDDAGPWMAKHLALREELARLTHREVDLVLRHAIASSPNYIRRNHVLESAQVVYEE